MAKTLEGKQHLDRDALFRYINQTGRQYIAEGLPVISVDTKKKELVVGRYAHGGREWRPAGEPEEALTHWPAPHFLVQ